MRKEKSLELGAISKTSNFLLNLFFSLYSVICIFPILLVVAISFTDETSLVAYGYSIIPQKLSLDAYTYIMKNIASIMNAYGITVIATIGGTVLSVIIIALYAYPLSRKDFKYRKLFTFILFVTMVFNGGMVPWYLVCTQILNIQNTIWALILPYVFNAWYVIILRTFYTLNIPPSLVEAAKIDGATEVGIFVKIILPLSLPGLATIGLFQTLGYWNDWWLPLMLTTNDGLSNLQFLLYRILTNAQALNQLAGASGDISSAMTKMPSESMRMALCIITIGPIIFVYPFFQKYFVKGLTIGAVKG